MSSLNVANIATGGNGTTASPWTGWETPVNNAPDNSRINFPCGHYQQSVTISLKKGWMVIGDGRKLSVIHSNFTGDGFKSDSPVNSSTAVYWVVSDLGLKNSNPNNSGGGIVDVCGTYINIHRVEICGFKYGIILDQSELADVDLCDFGNQRFCGLWLVNGDDHTPSADGHLTNRISASRCQFNNAPGLTNGHRTIGIIDDGGDVHTFENNNYNGWDHHIYIAGTAAATIASGEFEGAKYESIISSYLTYSQSHGVGQNGNLTIRNNLIVAAPGLPCILFHNGSPLLLLNNVVNSTTASFEGTHNCAVVIALGNYNVLAPTGTLFNPNSTAPHHVLFDGVGLSPFESLEVSSLIIGKGDAIKKHLSATKNWNPPAIQINQFNFTTVKVPGAAIGDTVNIGFSQPLPPGTFLTGAVTQQDTVRVTLFNHSNHAINLASGTLRVDVWKH